MNSNGMKAEEDYSSEEFPVIHDGPPAFRYQSALKTVQDENEVKNMRQSFPQIVYPVYIRLKLQPTGNTSTTSLTSERKRDDVDFSEFFVSLGNKTVKQMPMRSSRSQKTKQSHLKATKSPLKKETTKLPTTPTPKRKIKVVKNSKASKTNQSGNKQASSKPQGGTTLKTLSKTKLNPSGNTRPTPKTVAKGTKLKPKKSTPSSKKQSPKQVASSSTGNSKKTNVKTVRTKPKPKDKSNGNGTLSSSSKSRPNSFRKQPDSNKLNWKNNKPTEAPSNDFVATTSFPSPFLPKELSEYEKPIVYNVTIIRKKIQKPKKPEPLILVKNSTLTSTDKGEKANKPTKWAISSGDDSKLESDEDDYDDDDHEDDNGGSTEEDHEEKAPLKAPSSTTTSPNKKGDDASISQDKDVKKKKGKKKKKKKADLHFVPKPLGPSADLMVRLDAVHHNVKSIARIVKGAFTDYVVKRPHVHVDFFHNKKGAVKPIPGWRRLDHVPSYLHRIENENSRAISSYPVHQYYHHENQQLSKRTLQTSCEDKECENVDVEHLVPKSKLPKRPKKQPLRIRLPYPIYIESHFQGSNDKEFSPLDKIGLPPISPSHFIKAEKSWVRTWDKETNGLPPIAGKEEASASIRRRQRRKKKKKLGKRRKDKINYEKRSWKYIFRKL